MDLRLLTLLVSLTGNIYTVNSSHLFYVQLQYKQCIIYSLSPIPMLHTCIHVIFIAFSTTTWEGLTKLGGSVGKE